MKRAFNYCNDHVLLIIILYAYVYNFILLK